MKDIQQSPYYKPLLKQPMTYVAGITVLAVLNLGLTMITGKPWGVTTAFAYWGAWGVQAVGGQPENWLYFQEVKSSFADTTFWTHTGSVTNLAIVIGALMAALLANQFRVKKIKNGKQVAAAVLGGLAMGVGARIASGCNIGALFSALPAMAVSGWMYLLFMFFGAWAGGKLLNRYFI
jgi:hypothetical protein